MVQAGFSQAWEQMTRGQQYAAAIAALRLSGRPAEAMLLALNNSLAFSRLRIIS